MPHFPTTERVSRRLDLQQQMAALHKISVALSHSLDLQQTLEAMIQVLHDHAFM